MTFRLGKPSVTLRPLRRISPALFALVVTLLFAWSCATGAGAGDRGRKGYLRFVVEPSGAEVEIDEQYSGVIERWVEGVVPVEPGSRRVTVRAEGFITQRFDIEVAAGEEVTLQLALEPVLDVDELPDDQRDPHRQRLRAMSRDRGGVR